MGNDVEALGRGSADDTPAVWRPALGSWIEEDGTHFRVWAPAARSVDLVIAGEAAAPEPMARDDAWLLAAARG